MVAADRSYHRALLPMLVIRDPYWQFQVQTSGPSSGPAQNPHAIAMAYIVVTDWKTAAIP
jgi:hypothetical protein